MIRKECSLFGGFFDKKLPESQKSTPVVITSYSQPHVLQQRMKEERLAHGDRVKADLGPVRLESNFGEMVMYFCPMIAINVKEKIEVGDGAALPPEAIIDGFESILPANIKPGLYTLKDATLFSNGTLQGIADKNTKFEEISANVNYDNYRDSITRDRHIHERFHF